MLNKNVTVGTFPSSCQFAQDKLLIFLKLTSIHSVKVTAELRTLTLYFDSMFNGD